MTLEMVRTEPMTRRERQVIAQIMTGNTRNVGIARALVISEHTVHFHLGSIMRKLGICSRTALVAHAWQNGVVLEGEWFANA